ncbi:MAG: FKBP-type peptidyl-prolyl cis-trans isomerase [Bacteroidia bacterium]|nr:FKBP-type peptidyl-prolyl cis-trans isomerase [Bacteroidia bacterium]
MWKCSNGFCIGLGLALLFCLSCREHQKQVYSYYPPGYYYRLLSFQPSKTPVQKKEWIQLDLSFSTQNDSVFWDSFNNFNDLYVLPAQAPDTSKALNYWAAKGALKDSFELLIPTAVFYQMHFKYQGVPGFSQSDSIVKVRAKLKRFLGNHEFKNLRDSLQNRELDLIRNYFETEEAFVKAKDSLGYYWVQRPSPWSPPAHFKTLDRLMVNYEGCFLNGRVFEKSKADFELIYGIPDQMVKGLNYVMGQLNEGQTAKIILPSALAFGENGSSNGTVPPYTPVLYNLKLTEVKRQ